MDEEPESQDIVPPEAGLVADRAIVLAAVSCRGLIEKNDDKSAAEDLRVRVVAWLNRLDVDHELKEQERSLLDTRLGTLDDRRRVDASWLSEGMVVLAWALGCADLPRYDEQCDPKAVADRLGFLSDRSKTPLATPRLRESTEIEHWADTYLTLHWRLRQFSLDRIKMDFANFVSRCTWGPLNTKELELIEGDLAIQGQRIDRVPEWSYRTALSIAQERHRAFNWLLGYEPIYSEVTTDT
jgi:hypothetical protein